MTWGGGKPHAIGDRGQRYEVTYVDAERDRINFMSIAKERGYSQAWIDIQPPKRRTYGWSDTHEGAMRMVASIKHHPVWIDPQIKDREAK